MVSKLSMESDTNTEKSERRRVRKDRRRTSRRSIVFSRLTRVIFLSHLFGLVILIVGAMTLNQYSQGLIKARIENLKSQALLVTSVMGDTATGSGGLDLPNEWRIRLHDTGQNLLLDSDEITADISVTELPPLEDEGSKKAEETTKQNFSLGQFLKDLPWRKRIRENNRRNLPAELRLALDGNTYSGEKYDELDRHIVTVSTPVKRVQEILGVVTLYFFHCFDHVHRFSATGSLTRGRNRGADK